VISTLHLASCQELAAIKLKSAAHKTFAPDAWYANDLTAPLGVLVQAISTLHLELASPASKRCTLRTPTPAADADDGDGMVMVIVMVINSDGDGDGE
jgi:hypothetical protein